MSGDAERRDNARFHAKRGAAKFMMTGFDNADTSKTGYLNQQELHDVLVAFSAPWETSKNITDVVRG